MPSRHITSCCTLHNVIFYLIFRFEMYTKIYLTFLWCTHIIYPSKSPCELWFSQIHKTLKRSKTSVFVCMFFNIHKTVNEYGPSTMCPFLHQRLNIRCITPSNQITFFSSFFFFFFFSRTDDRGFTFPFPLLNMSKDVYLRHYALHFLPLLMVIHNFENDILLTSLPFIQIYHSHIKNF